MINPDLWMPSASIEHLKQRADILGKIRHFFAERAVLEVETPVLARHSVTDPYMDAITADNPATGSARYYLQTSPEYAMKRLLAAGSGPIYQLCKALRQEENGSRHNGEFTMLEWYRPGFDYFQLMDEVAQLLEQVLGASDWRKVSYRDIFQQHLSIDPHHSDCATLRELARQHIDIQMHSDCCDDWLNLLWTELIEPAFVGQPPVFIYNYPASQAALARLTCDETGTTVAQRFELYVEGVELANGYFELTDARELALRLQQEQQLRVQKGKKAIAIDPFLLAAMEHMPAGSYSGVALGVDRLVMLALGCSRIQQVLAFPVDRA